jgi:HK97 family phage portal protein
MGLIESFRKRLRLAGREKSRLGVCLSPTAGQIAKGTGDALPTFYAFPWQTGRALAARTALSELPRHHAGWVYAAVRAIAQGAAGCELRFRTTKTPRHQESLGDLGALMVEPLPPNHPLPALFAEVNPFHTYRELVETTLTDLELAGNAFWVLSRRRVSGVPAEVWPVPPAWMKVVPGRDEFVRSYRLRRGSRETDLDPADVVHFRYPNPEDPYWGRAPLQAAMEAVKADESVARAQRRAFENGPIPGVIFKTADPLTADQRKRLRSEFESRFAGPDAAGRLIITERDSEVAPFTTSPREMDFLESARATRDRILGVFGVPPAVLGLVEDFNRANAEAAHMLFARDTLLPKLKLLAARITQDVCSQFLPQGITCEFASPVPADREADRRDMEAGVRLGVLSPNEARADHYGKTPVEGLDQPRPVPGSATAKSGYAPTKLSGSGGADDGERSRREE